jgi:hypothetical protein
LGEARIKRATRLGLLKDRACVFCGGARQAVQIDHVPPRIAFANKLRPKGLEFPSCANCNQGTRDYDQIVGLLSRLTISETQPHEKKDLDKLVRALRNNYRNVINDIEFKPLGAVIRKKAHRQFPNTAGVGITTGPVIGSVLAKFGAKLGFGLHYLRTGRIVPVEGAAAVRFLTNETLVGGNFPGDLVNMFPEYQSLRQGRLDASEQFGYSSLDLGADGTAHIAYFRLSFFLVIYVAEHDAERQVAALSYESNELHRPGDWKIPYSL